MKETRATRAEKILRDAYESGKLRRGRCTSCAVGILIADGMGYTVTDGGSWKEDLPNWPIVFSTNSSGEQRSARVLELFLDEPFFSYLSVPEDKINGIIEYYHKEFDIDKIETELKSTEFTIPELMKIEYTFETAPGGLEDKLNAAIELIHGLDKK